MQKFLVNIDACDLKTCRNPSLMTGKFHLKLLWKNYRELSAFLSFIAFKTQKSRLLCEKVTKKQKAMANRDARDMKPSRNCSHMAGRLNPRVLAENYRELSIDLRVFALKHEKSGKSLFWC